VGRHATLRAAIDWSYELLDEGEQRLLARMAVACPRRWKVLHSKSMHSPLHAESSLALARMPTLSRLTNAQPSSPSPQARGIMNPMHSAPCIGECARALAEDQPEAAGVLQGAAYAAFRSAASAG
jgi:hypothetical protein